ncbi:hypothetical protein B9K06_22795 [Bacillus sp. OG2]|nr:hypothetical protein B9K06_22795 [Bacillus sp. OG2]
MEKLHTDLEVIVYSNPDCFFCHQLTGWLNARGIPFTEKDINEEEARNEFKQTGAWGTPLTIIKKGLSADEVVGFNQFKLARLLNIK